MGSLSLSFIYKPTGLAVSTGRCLTLVSLLLDGFESFLGHLLDRDLAAQDVFSCGED